MAEADERFVPRLRAGQKATVRLRTGDGRWTAAVARIGSRVELVTRPSADAVSGIEARFVAIDLAPDGAAAPAGRGRDGSHRPFRAVRMALRAETRDRLAFALRLAFRQTSSRARRSVAAFLGIAGGLVLVLVQLGFQSALYDSAVRLHQVLDGDLVIVAPEFQALQGLTWIDRATLERAAGHPQVQSVRPLVMTQLMVRNVENDRFVIILALGIDVDAPAVALDRFGPQAADLRLPGRVLFDAASQPMYGPVVERLARDGEVELVTASPQRARQRAFVVTGLYRLGRPSSSRAACWPASTPCWTPSAKAASG